MQVASRFLLVWGIAYNFPQTTAHSAAFSTMLLAWSFTEVVRYSYFVFTLSGMGVPRLWTWLRYVCSLHCTWRVRRILTRRATGTTPSWSFTPSVSPASAGSCTRRLHRRARSMRGSDMRCGLSWLSTCPDRTFCSRTCLSSVGGSRRARKVVVCNS
jgi:hypothetical protein